MKKTETIYSKINSRNPIIVTEEILNKIKLGCWFEAGYEEAEYNSDSGPDGRYHLDIFIEREETELEKLKRIEKENDRKELSRQNRYQSYLRLKQEFEGND